MRSVKPFCVDLDILDCILDVLVFYVLYDAMYLKDLVISSLIQDYGFADSQELGKVFNKKWFYSSAN